MTAAAPIRTFCGPHRFLSNFFPCAIPFDGGLASSVEHAYQASKTPSVAMQARILAAPSPGRAKQLGRGVILRAGWEETKRDVMLSLLRQKFADPVLRQLLLDTGEAQLEEGNHWGDTYWGTCAGVGENWLGRLLMQVRQEVRMQGRPLAEPGA